MRNKFLLPLVGVIGIAVGHLIGSPTNKRFAAPPVEETAPAYAVVVSGPLPHTSLPVIGGNFEKNPSSFGVSEDDVVIKVTILPENKVVYVTVPVTGR